MFRRIGISLTILFAFLLVQGHNFIPHHHHEEEKAHAHTHHHDHNDHHDNPNSEDGGDDQTFHADHLLEFGNVLVKTGDAEKLPVKQAPVFLSPYFAQEVERIAESPPPIRPPIPYGLTSRFTSYSVPLRAPPSGLLPAPLA